jgi:hypothetical protein
VTPAQFGGLIRQINPVNLISYLKNNGWWEKNTDHPEVLRFSSPHPVRAGGPHITILIPKSNALTGSSELLGQSIKSIASFEKREVSDVISEVITFADCFKTRILGAKKGLLPLDLGILLYRGSFNLIKSSAIFEYNFSRQKQTKNPELALQCAKSSLMGPALYGSYIAQIYVPLRRPSSAFLWDTSDPFQRKVVIRILRGLANLRESEIEENPDPIINNYTTGLNIDMCSAIKDIANAGMGNKIIINAILEPAYRAPSDISTKFILSTTSKYYLDEAIKIFKENLQTPIEEKEVLGVPKILARPESLEKGTIRLKWYYPDINKTITVYVDLDKDDYEQAVVAHKDKKNILVIVDLERVAKKWQINNIREFRIISDDARQETTLDRFLN